MSQVARPPESRRTGAPGLPANGRLAALLRSIPPYSVASPLSAGLLFALPATLGTGVTVWYTLAFIWAVFAIASRRCRFSRDRPMWLVTALLSVFCAANALGWIVNGTGGSATRLTPLLTLLALPFTYTLLAFSRKRDVARAALVGSAVACCAAAAVAVVQFYFLGIRAEGMAGNALVFAHVTTLAGCLCLAGLTVPQGNFRGRSMDGLLAAGVAAAVLAVVLSGSRAYWLAFPIAAACILLFRRQRRFGRGAVAAAAAAALLLGTIAYKPVAVRMAELHQDWHTLSTEGRYDTSLGLRLKLWEFGAGLVREHPLIGYGTPSKKHLIKTGGSTLTNLRLDFSHFHNGFLTAAVEAGMIGLAMLLGVFAVMAVISIRALREGTTPAQRLGGCMLAVLFLTCAVSGSVNIVLGHDILDAVFMSWLMLGLFLASGTAVPDAGERAGAPLAS